MIPASVTSEGWHTHARVGMWILNCVSALTSGTGRPRKRGTRRATTVYRGKSRKQNPSSLEQTSLPGQSASAPHALPLPS